MVSQDKTAEDVRRYASRLRELYDQVKQWIAESEPDARFSESAVQQNEEISGPYTVASLEVGRKAGPALRFVPRGMYMIGAQGRVDVKSRLGSETLVWVAAGGPAIHFRITVGGVTEPEVAGRPLFPDVEEGWAWVDPGRRRLLHLDGEVFRTQILESIGW